MVVVKLARVIRRMATPTGSLRATMVRVMAAIIGTSKTSMENIDNPPTKLAKSSIAYSPM